MSRLNFNKVNLAELRSKSLRTLMEIGFVIVVSFQALQRGSIAVALVLVSIFFFLLIFISADKFLLSQIFLLFIPLNSSSLGTDLRILFLPLIVFVIISNRTKYRKIVPSEKLFIAIIFLIGLLGFRLSQPIETIAPFLMYAAALTFALAQRMSHHYFISILWAVSMGGFTSATISILQKLGVIGNIYGAYDTNLVIIKYQTGFLERFSGNLGDYQLFGLMMLISFGVSIILIKQSKKLISTFFLSCNVLLNVICIYLTSNRSTYLELILIIIFFTKLKIISLKTLALTTMASLIVFFFLGISNFASAQINTFYERSNYGQSSLLDKIYANRFTIIENYLTSKEISVLGSGFPNIFSPYPHNLFIFILISSGIIGAILFLTAVVFFSISSFLSIKSSNIEIYKAYSIIPVVALIDSNVVEPFRNSLTATLFVLTMYMLVWISVIERQNSSTIPRILKSNSVARIQSNQFFGVNR
jgi:hypothetical protein